MEGFFFLNEVVLTLSQSRAMNSFPAQGQLGLYSSRQEDNTLLSQEKYAEHEAELFIPPDFYPSKRGPSQCPGP